MHGRGGVDEGLAGRLAAPGRRRIPAPVWEAAGAARRLRAQAEEEARRLVEAARAEAERLRGAAVAAGREEGLARASEHVARAALARDRLLAAAEPQLVELGLELARRIVERAAALDPAVVVELAGRALDAARARAEVTLRAHPADLAALREAEPRLAAALTRARPVALAADPALGRGEVRVETEAGVVEARLGPQLAALRRALSAEEDAGW